MLAVINLFHDLGRNGLAHAAHLKCEKTECIYRRTVSYYTSVLTSTSSTSYFRSLLSICEIIALHLNNHL